MPDLELAHHQLFPTSIYRTHLSMLEPHRELLVADVLAEVARNRFEDVPGHQTHPTLHERTEPHWRLLYTAFAEVVEFVARQAEPGTSAGRTWTLKSWGLVLPDAGAYDSVPTMTHTHWGYTWSSVLWLDLPNALGSSGGGGGTAFRDPLSFVRRGTGAGEGIWHHVPPGVLDLVIFPSYLEHLPSPPPPGTTYDRPRVVVSTDAMVA
jgi:hypothetical protein